MNVKKARSAILAGLGFALAIGPVAPALAETKAQGNSDDPVIGEYANPEFDEQVSGTSEGDTKLYIIGKQDDLTTSEGSITEQVKVSIPVAIHYVAEIDADGNGQLVGPSNDVVKFVNHTKLGAVHISKIQVDGTKSGNTEVNDITLATNVGTVNDRMSFNMQPVQGQSDDSGERFVPVTAFAAAENSAYKQAYETQLAENLQQDQFVDGSLDELGNYSTTTNGENTAGVPINPINKNDWNILQKNGALGLNSLTGKIGGFSKIDPSTDYPAGVIHWTVRAGTRKQADTKDATVTIHFNSNNGSNKDCVPVADQKVVVLNVDKLPVREDLAAGLNTAITAGTGVEGPKTVTNADGTVTTYTFKEWRTSPDRNSGAKISKISDLGTSASEIAGKTFEVYAIYDSTTI